MTLVAMSFRSGGATFTYAYDALDRVVTRDAPGAEPDTVFSYDNFSRVRSLPRAGQVLNLTYDGLGRLLSEAGPLGAVSYQYDAANRRTRLSWPDGQSVSYHYDLANAVTRVDAPSGALLAQFAYDDLGRRSSLARGNGVVTHYTYDGGSRLVVLRHDFPAVADMETLIGYNPASQATLEFVTPSSYAYAPPAAGSQAYASNRLNQYTQAAGEAVGHNTNGAQVSRGGRQYGYDSDDRLVSANAGGGAALGYDPAGRLGGLNVSGLETRFLYDGGQLTAETAASGAIIRRYIPGPGVDETLAMVDASGVSYPITDQRNTPSAWVDPTGALSLAQYGAFGEEGPANIGRIGFTGQMRLPEIGLDYYKARFYDPQIGRFLTPDPAGFVDGPNLYAYVLNDPINNVDPSGLQGDRAVSEPITIPGQRPTRPRFLGFPNNRDFASRSDGDGRANGDSGGDDEREMLEMMCPTSSVSMPRGMLAASNYLGSFGQGFGDALTFGLYSEAFGALPFGLGERYDSQKENGGGYTAGLTTGFGVGLGRVAYAGAARLASALPARGAVAVRNGLKGVFSGLGSAHPRNYTYDQMLRKYGSDSAVKAAAGRSNNTLNAAGAGVAASAGAQLTAGCP